MGLEHFRKPFHNSVLPLDLETQMKRRLQLFPRERGKADMNRINQPDKNLCKCQKNHTEGSVKVMVRYSRENIPQSAGANRETTDPGLLLPYARRQVWRVFCYEPLHLFSGRPDQS